MKHGLVGEMLDALGYFMQEHRMREAVFQRFDMRGAWGVYIIKGRHHGGPCGYEKRLEGDDLSTSG